MLNALKLKPASQPSVKLEDSVAEDLRVRILEACAEASRATVENDKSYLRALNLRARANAGDRRTTALSLFAKHQDHFRRGSEINVEKICPVLRKTDDEDTSELFLIARSLWSMPYNKGYGRRLRFVVYDEYHEGVIGIIGMQSPPADLSVRDQLFQYPPNEKLDLVNSTMDAYAVGAVPPYSYLLGGKLCAGLICANEIRQAYWRVYGSRRSLMQAKRTRQPLAAVTTTSAFGRSSQYNRLNYLDRKLAEPIGYTMGFGTMHLEHLYDEMCDQLRLLGKFTSGGFGHGPKVRWQNIVRTLGALGLSPSLLRHGLKREVFLFRLVDDLEQGMSGGLFGVPLDLPAETYCDYWKERWANPRAARYPMWNTGDEHELIANTLAAL